MDPTGYAVVKKTKKEQRPGRSASANEVDSLGVQEALGLLAHHVATLGLRKLPNWLKTRATSSKE